MYDVWAIWQDAKRTVRELQHNDADRLEREHEFDHSRLNSQHLLKWIMLIANGPDSWMEIAISVHSKVPNDFWLW